MEKLRIIYKKDLFGNEYAYGIRCKSGYLLFFRKVTRFPDQDERYEEELIEMNLLAKKILAAMKNF